MKHFAKIDGESYEIVLEERDGATVAKINGDEYAVDFHRVRGQAAWSLRLDDRSLPVSFEVRPDGVSVTVRSESYVVNVEDERARAARAVSKGKGSLDQTKVVLSMMPGIVREVRVEPGDTVAAGDALLILEAMKMENEIRAALDGVVKTVHITPDSTVNKGDALVTLE
ncbi:MAG: biotin/lipoyl-containing protein [Planctomycetota bacterium]